MPEYTLNIKIDGGSDGNKAKAKAALNTVNNKTNLNNNANKQTAAKLLSEGGSKNKDKIKLSDTAKTGIASTALVLHSALGVARYKLSHYGSKYSYQARQNQINNVMTTVGDVTKFGATIAAGAAAGGPVGAIVGVAAAVFDLSYQMYERNAEWTRQNHQYELEQSRTSERLGLLASDRNRGK